MKKIMRDVLGGSGLVSIDPYDIHSALKRADSLEILMFEGFPEKEIKRALRYGKEERIGGLVNITGSKILKIEQCQKIIKFVASRFRRDAIIMWGAQIDKKQKPPKVTVLIAKRKKKGRKSRKGKREDLFKV